MQPTSTGSTSGIPRRRCRCWTCSRRQTYGESGVIKLLGMERNDATIMKFTSRLRTELVTSWADSGKTPEEIFTLLKLDRTAHKMFTTPPANKDVSNPTLNLYAVYLDEYNLRNPNNKWTMLEMFSRTYGDDVVANMIEIGMKTPTMKKVSAKLQDELLSKWDDSTESADEVFTTLKLDQTGYDLFAAPQLNTWYAFIKKGYVWEPEDVMLLVLVEKYGYDGLSKIFILGKRRMDLFGELPMKLENRMVNQWLESNKSPDELFELLQLNRGLDSLLTNPNLRMWESYRTKLSSQKPEKVPPIISTILKYYSVEDLSAMLKKAQSVPATANIATKWQHELASKIKR